MRKKTLFLMCLLLFAGVTQAGLFQHLDASRSDTVVVDNPIYGPPTDPNDPNTIPLLGHTVSRWNDVSGNGRDATLNSGQILYPSTTLVSSGGFMGLDFTTETTRMIGLSAAQADYLLNFDAGTTTGDPNTGISFLMAFLPYDIASDDSYPIGTNGSLGNFSVVITSSGTMKLKMQNQNDHSDPVEEGLSYVYGGTFDPVTGALNHWLNDVLEEDNQPANDYADGNPFRIGAAKTVLADDYRGMIGELMLWDEAGPADFEYQRTRMYRKWVESRAVNPMDGVEAIATSSLSLAWLNLLPDTEGQDVYVDVYFGTDPNRQTMTQVLSDGLNATTATANASGAGQTYYWAVDTSFGGPSGDPNFVTIEGPFYSFTAVADPSPDSIEAGPDYITWIGEGVPIDADIFDGGSATIAVTFTSDDPNMVFSPNPVYIAGGGVPKSTVTASTIATTDWQSGDVIVTATAEDDANPGTTISDTMGINVYNNPCVAERQGNNQIPNHPEDLVLGYPGSGCVIDLEDFAAIAAKWMVDYSATAAFVTQ